jgi:hypothetical protein
LKLLFPRLPLGHPEKETVRIPKIYILQYLMMILALNENVGNIYILRITKGVKHQRR